MKHVALHGGEYRRREPVARHMSDEETGGVRGEAGGAWTADDRIAPLRPKERRLPPGMY